MPSLSREMKFKAGAGKVIAVGIAEATETTLKIGTLYRLNSTTACACRFGATAVSVADGGYDFSVQAGDDGVAVRATSATLRAIRVSADGTLFIQEIDEGV